MHTYMVHTLVDITDNGLLRGEFPFKTKSGEVVHDKQSLFIARNQNSNYTTMLQLLQIRGNITWEKPPTRIHHHLVNTKFGTTYLEGKHLSWHFEFQTEQTEVYGDISSNHVGQLIEDFDLVPILSFCKETVTYPSNTFITQNDVALNTYFSYQGEKNK